MGGVDLAHFDILVAAATSPQGTTQMTPPRHRPGQKPGKRAHTHTPSLLAPFSLDELFWHEDVLRASSNESEHRWAFRVFANSRGNTSTSGPSKTVAPAERCWRNVNKTPISVHVRLHCAEPSPAFCAVGKRRRGRRDGFSRLDPLPMDDGGPLSPKANAFSIASLISAAEQAGNAAFDKQSTGLDLHNRSSFKMHYSTVTREMEGKSVCWRPKRSMFTPQTPVICSTSRHFSKRADEIKAQTWARCFECMNEIIVWGYSNTVGSPWALSVRIKS